MFPQQVHGLHDFFKYAVAPASVVCLFKSLQTDGWDEIFYPQHFFTKRFVNQGAVRE